MVIKLTPEELAELMKQATSENPVPMRFGPGWVAIDKHAPGANRHIERLSRIRNTEKI